MPAFTAVGSYGGKIDGRCIEFNLCAILGITFDLTYIDGGAWRAKYTQGIGDEEQDYEDIKDDEVKA